MTITVSKHEGCIVGFDLIANGKVIAPIRLSSNGLITAGSVEEGGGKLRFTALTAKKDTGLMLGPNDYVEVARTPDNLYPQIRFRFTVAAFDTKQWERNAGRFPFHFLTLNMPNADVFHQRGWLMATPKADPFPLLLDVHVGTPEICSNWSRNWSYAPPIGCYPIPATGLWSPSERLFAAYDFMESRLEEQSERYIAAAYCWKEGADRQFITLLWPYQGKGFQTLTYPEKGTVIEGRFRLIYSTAMPPTEDPNTLLQEYYFKQFAKRFPRVPRMNDMSWMPGGTRLKEPLRAPRGRIVYRREKPDTFEEAGTVGIGGWTWHRESAVFSAYRRKDEKVISQLKEDLSYLLTKAERFTIEGDECLFWPKPIEGKWRDNWGGEPVKTLHNANGWAAGIVLVDFYRHDKTAEYLPIIDGIYNWTKHFVWTRNEFADVPSSPFAIGSTLSAAFLLDYYFAFKNDPQRAERAKEAMSLARKIIYRYMPVWVCDNDRDDNLDPAFLWEPNSGRDWTGTACANEVHWNLDALTQVYVNCGDPIMNYYLRGTLERWHLLYKDVLFESVSAYPRDALSEWLGFFDGTMAGRGGRADFGTGDVLPMHYPVGDSLLRVTCGEKAAFACCKKGTHSQIEDYRYSPEVNFAFTVRSKNKQPFDITVSFPFADIMEKPVTLTRASVAKKLEEDKDVVHFADSPSYVYIRGVQDGDKITVGTVSEDAQALRIDNDLSVGPLKEGDLVEPPFQMSMLTADKALSSDWEDVESFAGLWPGKHYAWSVPYLVAEDLNTGQPLGTSRPCTLDLVGKNVSSIFLFFAPTSKNAAIKIEPDRGAQVTVTPSDGALAWRSWPPCFKQKIVMAKVPMQGVASLRVIPQDAYLLAATALCDPSQEQRVSAVFERGMAEFKTLLVEEQKALQMAALVARVPEGRIAILPARSPGGPVLKALQRSGLAKKCRQLKPADLLDPNLFNAKNFPLLLNLSGEEYAGTIKQVGDGAEAILNYLRSGGFIIMLTTQPLPFFYDGLTDKHVVRSLTPRMGFPISIAFEKPPEGEQLQLKLNLQQTFLTGLPETMPYFTEGDLRLRTVDHTKVSPDALYTPIVRVVGPGGKNYGDAAAYAEYKAGPYKGARILYIWSRLLKDKDYGPGIIEQMVKFIITQAEKKQQQ